ncbi:uncharacterized protein DS421_20g703470 [Arachis hypogaea]|nr:uncharacterized protein DS421_20g703470 [Arachis hypogaea]
MPNADLSLLKYGSILFKEKLTAFYCSQHSLSNQDFSEYTLPDDLRMKYDI